jgi:hypothetical protein
MNGRYPTVGLAAVVFEKRFAGRRQFNAVCAAVHQLNGNLLFEISDLPTEDG